MVVLRLDQLRDDHGIDAQLEYWLRLIAFCLEDRHVQAHPAFAAAAAAAAAATPVKPAVILVGSSRDAVRDHSHAREVSDSRWVSDWGNHQLEMVCEDKKLNVYRLNV